ncbi:MAG: DUF167 domain-containing protein [Thermodesulfobacteriota bacterium]|nr:DUF167 domain-containing protein [Thermodesulfobacteriota bacterium]
MDFLSSYKDGRILLKVYVQPRASKNRFIGLYNDAIKLAITAPPVDGKANAAVIRFLASVLNLQKKDLEIKHGLQSRKKSVLITGVSLDNVRTQIQSLTPVNGK